MILFRRIKRHPVLVAIASPFVILMVIVVGVIALPCETMKVVLTNESDTWVRVRVGVHYPTRDLWIGDLAARETRTLSLAAIPMSLNTDVFVLFPELGSNEITRSEEIFMAGYPLGIGIHRYRFSPGNIDSDTVFDLWADHFESKPLWTTAFILEFLFIVLRCADCEAAAWLRGDIWDG